MSRKPDFFIVGAPKSGTTALYNYLKLHPDIFLSPLKEPNFFASDMPFKKLWYTIKLKIICLGFLRQKMKNGLGKLQYVIYNRLNLQKRLKNFVRRLALLLC